MDSTDQSTVILSYAHLSPFSSSHVTVKPAYVVIHYDNSHSFQNNPPTDISSSSSSTYTNNNADNSSTTTTTTNTTAPQFRNRPAKTSVHILCDTRGKGQPDLNSNVKTSIFPQSKVQSKNKELNDLGKSFVTNIVSIIQSRMTSKVGMYV